MKRIISVILVIATITMLFAGCTTDEDLNAFEYGSTIVDISTIVENKLVFENRVPSTKEQENFKKAILNVIAIIESNNEMKDFTVTVSDEIFNSWEECNDYAEEINPGSSHLGTYTHYILFLAQRIVNKEVTWDEIFDIPVKTTTLAFSKKECWVGSCTGKCGIVYLVDKGECVVRSDINHPYNYHENWQAFIVTSVS